MSSPTLAANTVTPWQAYTAVRSRSDWVADALEPEDCVIQSMPDVSPTRWHLAHTTWFFETFLLAAAEPDYTPVDPQFEVLFNSYYNQVGEQFPRPRRGLLSRPTVREVFEYRAEVDRRMADLLGDATPEQLNILELGLQHEQQHQELMLTDIKHVFSCNPLGPVYRARSSAGQSRSVDLQQPHWQDGSTGIVSIGHDGPGFCFDNEQPMFDTLLHPHQLATRLVTCGEFLEFIEDGGYEKPELWLSLGWSTCGAEAWRSPMYWQQRDGAWQVFTLSGWQPVSVDEPVTHVSYFEADAFARWNGCRLPTEFEWEAAARDYPLDGNFVESERLHPAAGGNGQWFGDTWEWTSSSYQAYPGYRAPAGALGEYNGKFMCQQHVLRGGSCVTPQSHIRASYRNFFPPEARWQFTGIRLARDV